MAPINALYSNYESTNGFMRHMPTFSERLTVQRRSSKESTEKYKEHLVKAKLERNYYNKNMKLAEQQRKLVDENYGGKANFCSIDATAHYSYDWVQNVSCTPFRSTGK